MTPADGPRAPADRFEVVSPDGTPIAVWVDGQGPPLLLVHGGLNDHRTDLAFVAELRPAVTTFAVDRRGRGASGDAPGYSIEREFEDVAAVVDAVAARTGRGVAVWGHSYGADCAMGAATLTEGVDRLVLYEPGLGIASPAEAVEAVEEAVAAGDFEAAAVAALVGIVGLTDAEVAFVRSSPTWPVRLEAVPALAREVRAEAGWVYEPGQFAAVTAPTLLLAGADSPAPQQEATRSAAEAIPHATVRVLEGHTHIAHRLDPAMVAAIVVGFVGS